MTTFQALTSTTEIPLQKTARQLHEAYEQREQHLKHAAGELEQLATDMLTYRQIPAGACLP
jgi:hypothetical protein